MTPMNINFEESMEDKTIYGKIDNKYGFSINIVYASKNDREDISFFWDEQSRPKDKEYRDKAKSRIFKMLSAYKGSETLEDYISINDPGDEHIEAKSIWLHDMKVKKEE